MICMMPELNLEVGEMGFMSCYLKGVKKVRSAIKVCFYYFIY